MKVEDHYTENEFEDLLDAAERNAKGAWADNFTSDMRAKFDEYGVRMFISDRQIEMLEKLADE